MKRLRKSDRSLWRIGALRYGAMLLLLLSVLTARGSTGYFWSANADNELPSDFITVEYGGQTWYEISGLDLSGMKSPVLTITGVDTSFKLYDNFVGTVLFQTAADSAWRRLSVDVNTGQVLLPTESVALRFTPYFNTYLKAVKPQFLRISERNMNPEELTISDAQMAVLRGAVESDRINADADGIVEVSYANPEMRDWTQGRMEIRYNGRFLRDTSVLTVTAVTPEGEYELYDGKPRYVSRDYIFQSTLPANTSEVRLKWVLDATSLAGAGNGYISYPTINGEVKRDFLAYLGQPAYSETVLSKDDYTLSTDSEDWYDVDADGVLDFCYGGLSKMYYDRPASYVHNRDFPNIDRWINYGGEGLAAIAGTSIYDIHGTDAELKYSEDRGSSGSSYYYGIIDYNNDGRNDIWFMGRDGKSGEVLTYLPSGSFEKDYMKLMTPQEYYDYVIEHGGGGLGSGLSIVGSASGPTGAFGSYQSIDINNDGYFDFIDPASGVYLLNAGNGRFVRDSFAGRVEFRDFNGDGINDMVCYDSKEKTLSITLSQKDADPLTTQLMNGYTCSDRLWCRDFDRDGDIDILVPFNAADNNGQSFLVMLENKGDGTFRMREQFLEGRLTFKACADIDGDGAHEVVAVYDNDPTGNTRQGGAIVCYPIEGISIGTQYKVLAEFDEKVYMSDYEKSEALLLDYDNSGRTTLAINRLGCPIEGECNMRPERPAAPRAILDAATGELTVEWEPSDDTATAPLDLTYELRIGTAPDSCDILWVDALPDGRRRSLSAGNCGYSTRRRFDTSSWPKGELYISVQAIDEGGLGSEFSEYAVVEKNSPAAGFIIITGERTAVTDECVIRRMTQPESDITYEWNTDGATTISEDESEMTVVWNTPGDKNVTLRAVSADGSEYVSSRSIHVMPARIVQAKIDSYSTIAAVDLDLDGVSELLLSSKFYEYDAAGNYTPLKKLFNNNFTSGIERKFVDINRDGLPDMVSLSAKGNGIYNVNHLLNEGDKSMNIADAGEERVHYTFENDIDNDGLADARMEYEKDTRDIWYSNTGDYADYLEQAVIPQGIMYDYDGDGLLDIVRAERLENIAHLKIYRNINGERFEEIHDFELDYSGSFVPVLGDIDADGGMDVAWTDAGGNFGVFHYSDYAYIRWADGEILAIPAPAGHKFSASIGLFDYDNNGCEDLLVNLIGTEDYVVIFFNSDRSWSIENIGKSDGATNVVYRRGDGRMGVCGDIVISRSNERPSAPSGVRSSLTDEALVIEWDAAEDEETPSAALKYNVSIKRKGAEGDNAYFMSPLNGGLDYVPVPTGARLFNSTKLTIPDGNIAPGRYEVKVQAVDSQYETGAFSEVYEFEVEVPAQLLELPEETMVGRSTEICMCAGYHAADFDFGADAVVENERGRVVSVKWDSEGEKVITCGDYSATIYVHPALNAKFELPETVWLGAKVRFACDNTHNSTWHVLELRDFESIVPLNMKGIVLTELSDTEAEMIFYRAATPKGYELYHSLSESYGSDSFSLVVRTEQMPATPKISIVDIDDATGCHRVEWNVPEAFMEYSDYVHIYKETSRLGEYEMVARRSVYDEPIYVDPASEPKVSASRYAISYDLPYGETSMSVAHQPIHLQLNSGGPGAWNLFWGKYEGRDITSYRILRGDSPATLQCIAEVSGSMTSYSDINPPASEEYYAVEILVDDVAVMTARSVSQLRSRSNVVSVSEVTGNVGVDGVSATLSELTAHSAARADEVMLKGVVASPASPARITVYDISGRMVYQSEVDSCEATIIISGASAGAYMVVSEGVVTQSARFIKR